MSGTSSLLGPDFAYTLVSVGVVILATVPHEVAHGWVAYKCGDPTAKEAGRLTLNPLKHLDPVGSVLLPLLLALVGAPAFGYARPVPYNPYRLRKVGRDEALVALAGPCANLVQALLGALVFRLVWNQGSYAFLASEAGTVVLYLLYWYVYVNCTLAFFNLLPVPPLDGSKVISPLLTPAARETYWKVQNYAMPILMAVLILGSYLPGLNLLDGYLDATAGNLAYWLLGV